MAHTYATVTQLKNFLRDQGETKLGTGNDALLLSFLEDSSRAIDEYCSRTAEGFVVSGFGPRVGTNRYDAVAGRCLRLGDDLLSISSVTARDTPTGSPRTLTDETHFFKRPYDAAPYRELYIHEDSSEAWGFASRGNAVAGTWGYADDRVTLTPTLAEDLDTSETGVDVSALTGIAAGATLLIGSEQLYVAATAAGSPDSLTVDRAANGTTAATHLTGATIQAYRYPRPVLATCLRLAQRRWRTRDSGVTGADGGGDVPVQPQLDSERSILMRGVWMYHLVTP